MKITEDQAKKLSWDALDAAHTLVKEVVQKFPIGSPGYEDAERSKLEIEIEKRRRIG